ncbi:MAG: M56 family metallopeptidase [Armatimonadota bacterium]
MFTHLITLESASWLLDILLKSAVLLALADITTLACWRASAAQRHLIWTLAVIGVLLLPVLSAILPAWHVVRLPELRLSSADTRVPTPLPSVVPSTDTASQIPSHLAPSTPTVSTPATVVVTSDAPARPAAPEIAVSAPPSPRLPWYLWVTLAWGIGTAMILVWHGYGYVVTRRMLIRTRPASAEWISLLTEVAGKQRVRVLMSDAIAMPSVVGLIKPTMLLPAQAEDWSEERRRVVLLHELAHLQRHDLLSHLLAQIACAVYWLNPLIWFTAHRMRIEREIACDDAVLGTDIRASDYATHLLAVASMLPEGRCAPVAGIAMAWSSKVGRRIKGVLDGRRNRRRVSWLAVMVLLLLGLPVLVTLAIAQGPTGRPKPPTSTSIPFPESTYTRLGVISRDGQHVAVAYQDKQGVTHLTLDGKAYAEHPATESITSNNRFLDWEMSHGTRLTMSPDGTRLAYVITMLPPMSSSAGEVTFRSRKVAIVDGKRSQEFIQVTLPAFSADSKHVAYAGYVDGKWRVWLDGTPGPEFDAIVYHSTDVGARLPSEFINNQGGFSRDGRHFGYVATRNEQWYVVVDGEEYGPYRSVTGFTFAGTGGGKYRFAFVAIRNRGEMSLIVDGEERAGFENLSMPSFSTDGNHLAYFAVSKGKSLVLVRDDKETALNHLTSGTPLLSHDGAHIAYAVPGTEGQGMVYLDQHPTYSPPGFKPTVDTVRTSLRFSPDGESVYFIGEKGWCVRGKRNLDLPPGDVQLTFAPDGRPAYVRAVIGGYELVFDGHALPPVAVKIESITFSPSGDLVYYVQRKVNDGTEKERVVSQVCVNGTPGDEYEGILPFQPYNAQRFFVDAPDRFHYFAVKDGAIHQVEVTIPPQASLASPDPLPTFTVPAEQTWKPVTASPSGRYLAVPNPQVPGGPGIWVSNLQTGTWTKVWDRAGEIQWLPDEQGMIVAIGGGREREDGRPGPRCTFFRVSLDGTATQLTEVTDLCDWLVIPDGSGLVATRYADRRQREGVTEIQVETRIYPFANRKWMTKHIAPFIWPDGLIGVGLALRKDHNAWVLSYTERRTGDNSEWWVNLTTGKAMQVHGGDDRYYSLDGQYAVDGNQLFRARTWPTPPAGRDWGGNALVNRIRTFPVDNVNTDWAPDGRHIAYSMGSIDQPWVTAFDLQGKKTVTIKGDFAAWVGPEHLLVSQEKSSRYLLYPLAGGAGREVFRFQSGETATTAGTLLQWVDEASGKVLFTDADIKRFDWDRQIFELTEQTSKKLQALPRQPHRYFQLKDSEGVIYRGTFYSPTSSLGFDGPAIQLEGNEEVRFYRIEAWYGGRYPPGPDLRYDPRLRRALEDAGVLGSIPRAAGTPPEAGSAYHGLLVSLTCEKSAYRAGAPVHFTVCERNTGDATLVLSYNRFPRFYHILLTDAQGKPVAKTPLTLQDEDETLPRNELVNPIRVLPGKELVKTYDLRQYVKALPPGTYTLQVMRSSAGISTEGKSGGGIIGDGALSFPCQININK